MRNIKELLIILKERVEIEENFIGLCASTYHYDEINIDEYRIIRNYLDENKPFTFYSFFGLRSAYWWKMGNKKPRLKWLTKQIKKL